MTARRGDSQGGVLSFTYLDVLVCTMGSLVLMLVMFAERAKKVALVEACKSQPTAEATEAPQPADPDALTQRLAEVRRQQAELERARAQAQQRLHDEQQRLSHLEEHQRRLEHELAKLHLTLKQLEASEQQQVVDQDQAEKELERLRQLIKDTEARLVKMREEGAGERSYAIVPYKGPNGTFRRPVYVECTREAIILQPEGIRLSADDFSRPLVSGNPLAAAIRAAQEELNARARTAGGAELPDPYPLFIVRPDGIKAYEVALAATRTWDSDYGYEFVDADWKLAYPDADPRLAQVMTHAIDTARQRQRLLAMAAPSRYGTRLTGTGGPGGGRGPGPGGYGGGHGGSGEQNANYNSTVAGSATIDSTGTIGDVRNDSADAMRAGGGGQSFSTPPTNVTASKSRTAATQAPEILPTSLPRVTAQAVRTTATAPLLQAPPPPMQRRRLAQAASRPGSRQRAVARRPAHSPPAAPVTPLPTARRPPGNSIRTRRRPMHRHSLGPRRLAGIRPRAQTAQAAT
jgi:TolA-binding protein